jgi:hypothetical protein
VIRALLLPLRLARRGISVLLLLLLLGSLGLNLALVTVSGAFAAVSALVERLTDLPTVRQVQRKRIDSAERRARSAESRTRRQARAVEHASRRISGKVTRSARNKLVTLPTKLVPAAGTFAVVGLTILEIREACGILGELRALDPKSEPAHDLCAMSPSRICEQAGLSAWLCGASATEAALQ